MAKSRGLIPFFVVVFAACAPGMYCAHAPESSYALVNGTLIDGTGATAVPDAVVLIEGARITGVGPRFLFAVPAEARVIDVNGGTILPGFVDAHVHYANYIAGDWARAGVTTIRSLGEPDWASRSSARSDKASDARIVSAGPIMTVPGGYPLWLYSSISALAISSTEEARKMTALLLGRDLGKDMIKIALEGRLQLSEEEIKAIVETAHQRGTVVSAHVQFTKDVETAIRAGVDDMAHMVRDFLGDELIEEMVRRNVYVVPTLRILGMFGALEYPSWNVLRFVEAGGKVAVGTDFNDYERPKNMYFLELQMMRAAGLTPLQVIVAATMNGAHVCNLEKEIGTLERGKMADIVVVRGDPLQSIDALADVQLVFRNGVVIRNEFSKQSLRED